MITGKAITEPVTPSFTLDVWVTGAPVVADSAPTTLASVPVSRRARLTQKSGSPLTGSQGSLRIFSVGGTSITYTPFFWDDGISVWVPMTTAGQSLTSGGVPGVFNFFPYFGAYFYCQIVSVTGGVTNVGYHVG